MFGKQRNFTSVGMLIDGLPVPANTTIIATLIPEGLEIKALIGKDKSGWKHFQLSLDKIENIQLMDKKQIRQVIEQSAPGMILGVATFGIVGAMIGGRTKTKEKVKISTLLVIDYLSEGKKQIVLDVTNNIKDSMRVVNKFKELKPITNSTIQL